tara:strand:+ start:54 stop:779 length:726 start_codon:yes stop_codon:yes gene_type:complete
MLSVKFIFHSKKESLEARKQLFVFRFDVVSMTLLRRLLPGIFSGGEVDAPTWLDEDSPWSIFDQESEMGLIEQIRSIPGSKDGIFIHHSATIGKFVEIEGPCYIGPNAVIRHSAFIREGSWICGGSLVGHSSEIKNSILLPGAKAPHFNYVGDSILGSDVNLGAGTKLSNVRNDEGVISVRLIGESGDVKVNTGLRKFGAILGDAARIGCNVVVNPGTIIEPGSMINPNLSISGYMSSGNE